ncbi:MAG TPA: transposase [Thermoanaerobaculia bacterium]|nr:transposase [Thermoanaerobaculia bacterium]
MARPLRIDVPGALHHVTSRGNERRRIFRSNRDREAFLQLLGEAVKRFGWSVTAWVLMENHFHLVIQTPEANLSRGMQWLNGTYADWFNRRHERSGHLFQGRFKSFIIESGTYCAEVLRYVVLNPVRAKMVARPEEYRWSSYRATAGLEAAPPWLDLAAVYAQFHPDQPRAQAAYTEYVMAKVDSSERLWDQAINGIYLGGEEWAKRMRTIVESRPRSTDHPVKHRSVGRPTVQKVIAAVAETGAETKELVRSRGGGPLRRLVAWLAWNEGLETLRTIAAALRLRSEGYVSNLIRRCERELNTDSLLLARFDAAIALLAA